MVDFRYNKESSRPTQDKQIKARASESNGETMSSLLNRNDEMSNTRGDRFVSLAPKTSRVVEEWKQPCCFKNDFYFVCMADTQLGMMQALDPKNSFLPLVGCEDVKDFYKAEKDFSRRAVQYINGLSPRPAFVVVCGDLVNAYPSQKEKHASEVEDYKEIFARVDPDIKLVCLCGNHDLGEKPSPVEVSNFIANFGADYFYFWFGGIKFVVLNSQLYKCDENCKELALQQDAWLDKQLEGVDLDTDQRVCVFTHIPPFIDTEDEADGYFTLSSKVRNSLLTRLAGHNCTHWFSGHFHRNVAGLYRDKVTGKYLQCITTAAIGGNIFHTKPGVGQRNELSGMAGITLDDHLSGMRFVFVEKTEMKHVYLSLRDLQKMSSLDDSGKKLRGGVDANTEGRELNVELIKLRIGDDKTYCDEKRPSKRTKIS
jgi:serine/threonine-protein phosphatase CPPED1